MDSAKALTHRVWILLPVHNRNEVTSRFVRCLKAQTWRDFHLVLIDDGSVDGTAGMVRDYVEYLTVLTGSGNWWWAGSLQQGFRWLKSQTSPSLQDVVLIMNDDTEFEPDFLARGLSLLDRNPRSLVLARCYRRQDGTLFDAGVHVDWKRLVFTQASSPGEINCLSTRGLFLRVSDLFEIGGFFPRLLPHYLSDYEFTIRAHRKGFRLKTDPSLSLVVDEQTTGCRVKFSDPFLVGMRTLFSKKCVRNPLARTTFILLACPWKWKFLGMLRVWYRALEEITQLLMKGRTYGTRKPVGK